MPDFLNQRIQEGIDRSILETPEATIESHVNRLEGEWSLERWIEAHAAAGALLGLGLTARIHPRFVAIPMALSSMLLLHGVQGFYPLLPIMRALGVRTRAEIDAEKYGLVQRLHPRDPEYLLARGRSEEASYDRVRGSTHPEVNAKIDDALEASVQKAVAAGIPAIRERLTALDKEWNIERILQTNASTLALTGLALSLKDRRWLLLTGGVFGFFLQHSIQGWCPPVPLLRRMGFRTQREIDREKYALLSQL